MNNKFTIIKLKPDTSTIDFEKYNKINEPITSIETSETNSLTKTGNFTRFPPEKTQSLTKISDYQFPSVKKIPNEKEPDSLIKKVLIIKKKKSLATATRKRKKPEL